MFRFIVAAMHHPIRIESMRYESRKFQLSALPSASENLQSAEKNFTMCQTIKDI